MSGNKSKLLAIISIIVMVVLAGCSSGSNESGGAPSNTSNTSSASSTGNYDDGTTLTVSMGGEPESLDPAHVSNVADASILSHLFSGLAKWDVDESGNAVIIPDAAESLPEGEANDNGTVKYTYTLKDNLKWSDGEPVKAGDFVYAWQRAGNVLTGGEYYYLFEALDGYSENREDASLNVSAPDDKTLEVVLAAACPYWNELLANPVFFPVREDVVSNRNWWGNTSTYVCNGPYRLKDWSHGNYIEIEKNTDYVDSAKIKRESIRFNIIGDAEEMLSEYMAGNLAVIDDVPIIEIQNLRQNYPNELNIQGQMGTYYICWNINKDILPAGSGYSDEEGENVRAEIRRSVSLLFDRNYIVDVIGQAGQVPASSLVPMGMTEPDGSQFYQNAGDTSENGYAGYYDTKESAVASNYDYAYDILTRYYSYDEGDERITGFPSLTYIYNTSEGHRAIAEYLQAAMAKMGLNINLQDRDFDNFLETRRSGDYDIARNFWISDYNDPISFLEMWTSDSYNNDVGFGKGSHANLKCYTIDLTDLGYDKKIEKGTWHATYDVIISTARREQDKSKRYELYHRAEDLLMSTGAISPLYYYTDVFMVKGDVSGFFSNPLGYKYFMYT